jgi:uncharacterized repeat protein (TIGR03803 family)
VAKLNWVTRVCGIFLLWATAAIALPAQTLTTLLSFEGTDGFEPMAPLVQAANGDLYGTTFYGGPDSGGTVFSITPSGTLTTIHDFCSQSGCPDGEVPYAGLVQATNGDLYGTTLYGGTSSGGTVFKITPGGAFTTLHTFCSQTNCMDGFEPFAGLVHATDGNLYGTTWGGGANGCGTVFKITPSGTLATLYSSCAQTNCTDGDNPVAGLVQATNGDFYGTTYQGGANGNGTIFTITPSGTLTTLFSFDDTEGAFPEAGLVQAANGSFYGTASQGGTGSYCTVRVGCGTVFKITPSGTLMKLYDFCSQTECMDGSSPRAGMVQATKGDFYGTTIGGGANSHCAIAGLVGCGTVFKITPSGALTTLDSFDGTDGSLPYAGLVQDTDGVFYGTTADGGIYNYGTVFSLSVGLKPFVETQPTSGTVGTAVNILGSNLTGATSVTFNGTPAVFTVVSKTLITTTVPAGATTGTVEVVRPNGKGLSNVPFTVLP